MSRSLGAAFELRLRRGRAYVERARDDQPVAALSAPEAVLLGLMDGSRSDAELRAILGAASPETGARLFDALVARLDPLLTRGRRPAEHGIAALSAVLPPDPAEGLRALPGPRVLHWTVTRFCPKRCVYCFAEPERGGHASDASLPRDDLARIFEEASALGAESLLVSGAEPLLREDLPEVLGDAIACGITPVMTTKHPISGELAGRLAAAGVEHISLSVDSMDEQESRVLIGSRGYPEQVRRTARELAAAAVAFSIQAVVTRLNPSSLDGVAAFAAAAGARVLQIVPYEAVRAPIGGFSNADLALSALDPVTSAAAAIAARHPSMKVEIFEKAGTGSRTGPYCDIGMTKLFFLPDGVVHRCYKLAEDDRLRGADLRTTSVAAAWHDASFRDVLSPPKEQYRASECGECGRFDGCHDEGRCIYQASIDHGRYTAPDRSCGGPHPAATRGPLVPLRIGRDGPPLPR